MNGPATNRLMVLACALPAYISSGAQFYVGYGTSADEMIAAGRYRILYQVP